MKKEFLLFSFLLVLIFISSCQNIVFNESEKRSRNIIERNPDCCIGCGVNECEKAPCPYECCTQDSIFQAHGCSDDNECSDNKCVTKTQAKLDEGEILIKEEDVFTYVFVSPTEIKPGGYIDVTILPGTKGYFGRMDFYNFEERHMVGYSAKCGRISPECYVKVIQKYKTSAFWKPGKYYVEIIDIDTDKPVRSYFDVVE